jgi:hypothetical protein
VTENELNEQNAPVDDEPVTADERARAEIAQERAAAAAPATVENLQRLGADAHTSEEQLAKDDLSARLATSTYGKGLSSRQVDAGTQQILAWEQAHGMAQSERMANWIGSDNDRLSYVMRKAAEGELSAPPSDAELNAVGSQIAARKELDQIYKEHPPGTQGHRDLMARIQMLWQIESGSTPICGKSLRSV